LLNQVTKPIKSRLIIIKHIKLNFKQQQRLRIVYGKSYICINQNIYLYFQKNKKDIAQQEHQKKLKEKFTELKDDINQMGKDPEVFRGHQLPLARVKKIMKSDEDVRMISAEAPVLFAKACEIFIIELTHRAWLFTEEGKRRTLQVQYIYIYNNYLYQKKKNDIAACIYNTEIFDFLIDIVPKEDAKANPYIQNNQQEIFQSMNPIGPKNFIKDLNNINLNQFQQNQFLSQSFMNNIQQGNKQ
ncbi:transcription factor hap5a family protein, putative, partial [Ichthyophthirius multifiliis]